MLLALLILMEYILGTGDKLIQIIHPNLIGHCPNKGLHKPGRILLMEIPQPLKYPHKLIMQVILSPIIQPRQLLLENLLELLLMQYLMQRHQNLLQIEVVVGFEVLEADGVRQRHAGEIGLLQVDVDVGVQVLDDEGDLHVDDVLVQVLVVLVDVVQTVDVGADVASEWVADALAGQA